MSNNKNNKNNKSNKKGLIDYQLAEFFLNILYHNVCVDKQIGKNNTRVLMLLDSRTVDSCAGQPASVADTALPFHTERSIS